MPVLKYWNPVLRSLHPPPRPRRRPSPLPSPSPLDPPPLPLPSPLARRPSTLDPRPSPLALRPSPSPPAAHTHTAHSAHSTCAPLPFRQPALHHALRPPRVCSRYYLGVLPESSIATSSATAVTLRALSLGAEDLPADTYVALALVCPGCHSRISGGASGGELWITFRGDGATCSDGHVPNSTFGTASTPSSASLRVAPIGSLAAHAPILPYRCPAPHRSLLAPTPPLRNPNPHLTLTLTLTLTLIISVSRPSSATPTTTISTTRSSCTTRIPASRPA